MAYIWPKVLPSEVKPYFEKAWMKTQILEGHGPLCDAYPNKQGAFNAEGDTPAFLHTIPTGLRNRESPAYGGWGGRYVRVRGNVWMDPLPSSDYEHPLSAGGIMPKLEVMRVMSKEFPRPSFHFGCPKMLVWAILSI